MAHIPEHILADLSQFYPWLISSKQPVRMSLADKKDMLVEGVVISKSKGEIILENQAGHNFVLFEPNVMAVTLR